MARIRTVDFLPEIFQTSTNRQFLGATLDQLVQEPKFKTIQGFVGRRVGPGVNSSDRYVAETTASRADYQLEPGVVLKNQENEKKINDAITYPGIIDALSLQGANVEQDDRLFTSEYYTWDPFVDFDKFVNFSQYYWLPAGPDAVDVFADTVPLTDNFVVTRSNGVYTFSGVNGNNPVIKLVRGGNYTFQVAQNQKETVNFRVTNQSNSAYVIDYQPNPTLTLVRGNTYVFNLSLNGLYPFYIKTQPTLGTTFLYNNGVDRNGAVDGLITFVVPQDAPDTLYYANSTEPNLQGQINVIDATPGTGPGFWIQAAPGVNGRFPATPNISSRDVLGVINNGEDLGTVTFNVPDSTAQSFYYNLTPVGAPANGFVDLVTNLAFNQINNQPLTDFITTYGGIDNVVNLDGKTLVFQNRPDGWEYTTLSDAFDESFDATVEIVDPAVRYSIWRISVVTVLGVPYITLNSVQSVAEQEKFSILYGTQYSNTGWYKNAEGYFGQIPLLTAVQDTLYYQDGTDPEIFGRIELVDQSSSDTLNVNDIIGQKNYTSPNGVVFSNGMKVQFIGSVTPSTYANNSYYVEGVGTAIKLLPVSNFVTPETYTKSATVPYDSTPYDVGNYDASLNQPLDPDYLTINKASPDLNAWSRSNRWTHIDVINATAEYNNSVAVIDNEFRAKRPILEFRAGTRLFNFGTQGKQPVDIIDFSATDALSTINGATGYSIDGYNFISGSRVIFAADRDPQVRNKIYVVEFISPDSVPPLIAEPIINLVPASDADILVDQTVVCLSGATQQGKSYYFDGVEWREAQQKTSINQAPLFDVYDSDAVSFGNRIKYPSTNFTGSKLFSYATATGPDDTVLGFPLKYLSLTNVGDIVFDNNLYTDTFTYTKDSVSTTENISQGFVREYSNRTDFIREIGWQTAAGPSMARQQFRFVYDGRPLQLDVPVDDSTAFPPLQLYVSGRFIDPNDYTYTINGDTTTIRINVIDEFAGVGDTIEVEALSQVASKVAFYTVPVNLENNPLNENSKTFTLGTIRAHYETIGENLRGLQGPINGANNSRDLGNIVPYGMNILQQSSPITLAGYFMRSAGYNVFAALSFNSREYEKFKAQLLDTVTRNDYTNYTVPQMLTAAITDINTGRTSQNPFYWSDMLPASSIYTENTYVVSPISTNVFDLSTTYDFTSSNYKGLLVYVNQTLLTYGYDYTVASDAPNLTITTTLNVGDVVTIQEYATTYGSFVPNTPTKLGLYPAFRPMMYYDTTYVNPTWVIQGHDGSKTIAFGTPEQPDFRDQLLLEFEKRIYNNLKVKSAIPLTAADVIPGQFRTTDYSLQEINNILSIDFLSWVGWNKLDYKSQDFNANNEFTWNYSASGNKLTGGQNPLDESPLPAGAWRGIYRYFYDTDYPNTRPWEMLGFSEEPTWWKDRYGEPPYTNGNEVLWGDLAAGYVADPVAPYFLPEYARPELLQVIPAGDEGQLPSPFDTVVGQYDSSQFQKSWKFGDGGPVEATWFKSSSYPFAIMRLLALTRPAEFFSLFADRDLYKYNNALGQYLYNERYRLDANGIQVYGNGVSKASYINWIVDYNQQLGRNSANQLETELKNLDVRLCYRLGAFSDKQYLKIYTEKSSPNSLNSSLLLPDESYNLLLYKNQPFDRTVYSSVIVQVVEGGYAVFGYSITQPYFKILVSRPSGSRTTIEAGGTVVQVPNQYTQDIVQIPYGYVFTNETVVVDFLLSYGALLESQGLAFADRENGKTLNWEQMAREFLYWANQGWAVGSVINLNPSSTSLTATKAQAVVDSIVAQTPENLVLDQNGTTLPIRDLVVDRFENTFKINSLTQQTISYLDLRYTSYENMVVLDNLSIFNDLIYDPVTGARQSRVFVVASVSAEWNGQVDAQGFILNNDSTVREWQPNVKYAKGEIVLYKNTYWSAQTIVQPSAEFDYSKWVKSDYTKIQRGLLTNVPNQADQLANSYNTVTANLETDQDLLSYGLIGFRPRQYMSSLNLSDVSQVNVYQQFLKDKGTIRSVRLLGNANLGKEVAEYNVYENWAIQRAVYGANANQSFFEIRLNEALLDSDPSVVQIIQPGQVSDADQTVFLENLWRQSFKYTSTDILPTTTTPITDTALPTAGYVNLDDVDITVFSLLGNLGTAPGVLETIGIGTTIWAAKVNSYDWNIYRCSGIPGNVQQIRSNLDTTSTVTFSRAHGLNPGDIIVIRFFDTRVDGVYRVESVPDLRSVTINLTVTGTISGQGVGYFLQTMRVAQASDAVNLPYAQELIPGAKIWVDNNGNNLWQVIEKQQPFQSSLSLPQRNPIADNLFGSALAQATNGLFALVGSPGYSTTGAVYPYLRGVTGAYVESSLFALNAVGTTGYGNAIDVGDQLWSVVGASQSNSNQGYATVMYRPTSSNAFEFRQVLVSPDEDFGTEEFGYSVTMSNNERWMYIGAPGNNKVYAFGLVDIPEQEVRYRTTTGNRIYAFNDNIVINNDQQLNVTLNNRRLIYGVDYSVTSINIVLTVAPPANQLLVISRKTTQQLDAGTYIDLPADTQTGTGSGALFTINRQRGVYSVTLNDGGTGYSPGDTITYYGTTIDGGSTPANDLVITVDDVTGSGTITEISISGSGVSNTATFNLTNFLYTATNELSFTVSVNGVLQRPFIDYSFSAGSITFINNPAAGANITVTARSYFTHVHTFDSSVVTELDPGARFGNSVSTTTDGRQVIIGAPNQTSGSVTDAGKVYAFDRNTIRYIVTDPNTTDFAIPAGSTNPVAVLLNNQYLNNSAQYINGQYTVDLGTNTVTIDSSVALNVGDIVEIETNIFNLIQGWSANSPYQTGEFGAAVDVCPTNCSVYIGSPNDGTIIPSAGSVDRRVNQSRLYGVITSTVVNPTLTAGDIIQINNTPVTVPNAPDNTVQGLADAINTANIPNVVASTAGGLLTIGVINLEASDEFSRLLVLPGNQGDVIGDLGLEIYAYTQTITSPYPVPSAYFGQTLNIDSEGDNLVVGAPNGSVYEPVTFDGGRTYFDDRSTVFSTVVSNSGVVYTFDYLPSATGSIANPGKFLFGQQIYDTNIKELDRWGAAVDYTGGKLLVGSPGSDLGDSAYSELNYGRVGLFNNPNRLPAWTVIHQQQPAVDIYALNSVYMYNPLQSKQTQFFDFFDPLQGKILGAARQNLDYITSVDPAKYNTGTINNNGNFWARNNVGQIWWNTSSARFIDPNQGDLVYASRRWGQLFPGSVIEIYQWVESTVPPAAYTGPGTVYNTTSYTVTSRLNNQGIIETLYYFWVTGIETIDTGSGKTLSTTGIARYIEAPRSSGIPYIAPLNANTIAIYNGLQFISAQDTVIHVDYDRQITNNNVHTEYDLIIVDKPDSFLTGNLYRKFLDSFCGVNTAGAPVPDPFLSPAEKYGVQFRPRQSMFINRFNALENYFTRVNSILKQYPMTEIGNFSLLNSAEPEPTQASGEWNLRLSNIEQLSYQNLNSVPVGYKYLIVSDSTQNGLWTIYTVIEGSALLGSPRQTQLTRVQTYDTRRYWYHIDWYQPGYNTSIVPVAEVPNYAGLATLSLIQAPVGSSVKVTANAQNKFEIYLRTDLGWDRVGLEDGTIQISEEIWNYALGRFGFDVEVFDAQYFDQEPVIETRKILEAVNQELFVGNLAIERNRCLILMFNFILSEQEAPEWLTKTSLINVEHNIRSLEPFQIYKRDNQEFVLDYIQEVKPYHVQISEFKLAYDGFDIYPGMMTDFDVPAYYNTELEVPQYVSPILLPYTQSTAVGTGTPSIVSNTPASATLWTRNPWNEWYQNYLLSIQDVVIVDGGEGYTVPPQVVITGDAVVPAEMTAIINSAGRVVGVNIINPGSGYSTTAVITFTGGNGTGARGAAVMGNDLVRSIRTTIKYDRYQYNSDIVDWEPNVNYDNGTQVRYLDQVWQANSDDSTGVQSASFDPSQWLRVSAGSLSGVNRTQGFYTPDPNEPGLDLPQLISGIDYPGVQVFGPNFNQNAGFDVGNYDINPFDNISYGPEGRPTYDPGILDATYESFYGTPATGPIPTGTSATDINVDGGGYVDTYSSHAPEELIPGAEFDTLDMRVYTRPGADWNKNGHGFAQGMKKYVMGATATTISFADLLPYPVSIEITNQNTGLALYLDINYTIDWVNQTITINSGATAGQVIVLCVYGLGGGNQLYRASYVGNELDNDSALIPVKITEIFELAVFVNGVYLPEIGMDGSTANYTYTASGASTLVEFTSSYSATDSISLTAIGPTTINGTTVDYSWSTPQTQYIVCETGTPSYELDNSIEYTNPVNLVVTLNGSRLRTAAGIEYFGDGSTGFLLPDRLGFSQQFISDNEVIVYVDQILQTLGVDYTVDPYVPGLPRAITFADDPAIGSQILIAVTTNADCFINSGLLVFGPSVTPSDGDILAVTTWNDTRQQDILTQVFVGPITQGITVQEGYDETDYDILWDYVTTTVTYPASGINKGVIYTILTLGSTDFTQFGAASNTVGVTFTANWTGARPASGTGTVTAQVDSRDPAVNALNETPGAYDYTAGAITTVNNIILGRPVEDSARLWVTLNGRRLFAGNDFVIVGEELVLPNILQPTDVLMITQFTYSVVPNAMAFRIFQDMRGLQLTYRITPETTTTLAQPLGQYDDIIYVSNALALGQPKLEDNIWGVITINGERIMYREIDYVNNTVSSLLRGTAGTGAADHAVDSYVYDLGLGNLLPLEYQNYFDKNTFIADGSTTTYNTDIVVNNRPVVYVGGTVTVTLNGTPLTSSDYTVTALEPVIVVLNTIPVAGQTVTITVNSTFGTSSWSQTTTGSNAKFNTDLNIGLVEQSSSSYTLDDFEPVTVTFNTPVPAGRAVLVTNQSASSNEVDFEFSDGINPTFVTTLDLGLPVRVYVAGIELSTNDYTVSSLDPVTVTLNTAPADKLEVTVLTYNGISWYQSDGVNPSNGVALQDTNTKPARFLRGLV